MRKELRVGIADDDETIRFALTRLLRAASDIDVIAAVSDGRAAVGIAQTGRIDVLVLDLEMPVMDGREALRLVRVLAPSVRVIMHSSRPASTHAAALLKAGAWAYLQKPCDARRLLDAIRGTHQGL